MFPVLLLEDDPIQLQFYKQTVENTIMINHYAMQIITASTTVADFEQQLPHINQGLFLLDMEIGTDIQAGLKLAIKIRETVPFAQIVFITTHDELSFLTLKRRVAPFDYILKDEGGSIIKQRLITDTSLAYHVYEAELFHHTSLFRYQIGDQYFSVPMNDITMLITNKQQPGTVILYADRCHATFPSNLSAIETEYPHFFRCDKSSLVNLDHMASFNRTSRQLVFNDGSTCKVSFRKTRELRQLLK